MKHWIISSLFVLLILPSYCQSPNLIFKHLNRSSGLPVDEVVCLAQDSIGFIWIGSTEGLFRYDGFAYKSFYQQPGSLKTIPNNVIVRIHVDDEGLIWVGTWGGLAVLNNNGELVQLFNSQTTRQFSKEGDRIFDIKQFGDIIWASTADGLYSIRKRKDHQYQVQKHDFKNEFHIPSNVLGIISIDRKGTLWFATLHGVAIYDPKKNTLVHSGNNPSSLKILEYNKPISNIYVDDDKNLVYYTTWEPSDKIYDLKTNDITTIYSGQNSAKPDYSWLVSQYLKDRHGRLWICSGRGIKILDSADHIEKKIVHQQENIYSLSDNQVNALLIDKEGALWAGTKKGISITEPYRQSLVNISANTADKFSFARLSTSAIIPVDSNTLLVGTYAADGIYRTDGQFNVQEHYSFGSNAYDWIWTYYKQGDSIFISTQKGNLVYHIKTKKIGKLTSPPFDRFFPVFVYAPGDNGSIWMCRYSNDFLNYDPRTKKYRQYGLEQLGEEQSVIKMAKDRNNDLWILSSLGGMLKFDQTKEKITERLPVNKRNGLLDTHIIFMIDVGDEFLIGYQSDGISLYNKKTKRFRHFSHVDGLASNSVTDAIQTDQNTVWITTRNGISRFDLPSKSFLSYGYENGILVNDFICISQLPDGRLAAGSTSGLVYFYPDKIKATQLVKPPSVTAINLYGNNLPVDSFASGQPLHVAYNQNYFSLEYISLQYSNNQQIEYAYKLEGFDKSWVNAGKRRFVSYSNLPGGNYSFKLRARLPGSTWVESTTALPINVATPFYKTWWFIPLCAFVFIALGYAIFRYRVQQLLRVEKMRQSISSDLHDEVGASLSSISIFSEMARQSLTSEKTAENYLRRIGDRSRESIEKMSDIIWSINPDNDSMEQMLVRMKTFVNETVEGKDIAIHWRESETIQSLRLGMAERKNFYLLFKEAFINAAKYSLAKNIYVDLEARHNNVFLKIRDDGKGFYPETAKLGNGIKNIKQRATLLGGSAIIDSAPGNGTSVTVQFRY